MAEGVETSEQLAVVRELGITAGQGYLLGRPGRERRAERLDLDALMPEEWDAGGRLARRLTPRPRAARRHVPPFATPSSTFRRVD